MMNVDTIGCILKPYGDAPFINSLTMTESQETPGHTATENGNTTCARSLVNQTSYPDTLLHATVCPKCQHLFSQPEVPLKQVVLVNREREVTVGKLSKCFICTSLWPSSESDDYTGVDLWLKYRLVGDYFMLRTTRQPILAYLYPFTNKSRYPSIDINRNPLETEPTSVRIVPKLTSNTGDESCSEQMLEWLRICDSDHKICQWHLKNSNHWMMPTRFIDLKGHPKLVETAHHHDFAKQQQTKYITLSHRWTQGCTAKLLKSNVQDLKQKLDYLVLPQVFRDTMFMAKRIGIFYVWIDALCIIQDDEDDWQKEASQMGTVYQNAYCNFGATAAATVKAPVESRRSGLFKNREMGAITRVDISRYNHTRTYCVIPLETSLASSLSVEPLLDRGWVFQERLLSPRSIFFGKVLSWECPELLATETFLEGFNNPPFRLSALIGTCQPGDPTPRNHVPCEKIYQRWLELVETYRLTELSYISDLLPAMSGLAHRFGDALKDEYLAGLWKRDMIRGLLWKSGRFSFEKTADELPHAYRGKKKTHFGLQNFPTKLRIPAPSWSWAAHDFSILDGWPVSKIVYQNRVARGIREETLIADLINASVKLAGSDMMGQVLNGLVQISGCLQPNLGVEACKAYYNMYTNPDAFFEAYDYGYDEHGYHSRKDTFFLMLSYLPILKYTSEQEPMLRMVRGLILKETGRARDEYHRVGSFALDPDKRAEFAGLDISNLNRQTITIV